MTMEVNEVKREIILLEEVLKAGIDYAIQMHSKAG
jgi:hypothetical protein